MFTLLVSMELIHANFRELTCWTLFVWKTHLSKLLAAVFRAHETTFASHIVSATSVHGCQSCIRTQLSYFNVLFTSDQIRINLTLTLAKFYWRFRRPPRYPPLRLAPPQLAHQLALSPQVTLPQARKRSPC